MYHMVCYSISLQRLSFVEHWRNVGVCEGGLYYIKRENFETEGSENRSRE